MNNVRDLIKRHEGLKLVPYRCSANHWTVGWGHNLDSHNEPIPQSAISLHEAESYLTRDIEEARQGCLSLLPNFKSLNEVRQAVLIDMCFNLGLEGLSKFKKTLRWLSEWAFEEASNEMLNSKWHTDVGKRAETLSLMMKTGEWV